MNDLGSAGDYLVQIETNEVRKGPSNSDLH